MGRGRVDGGCGEAKLTSRYDDNRQLALSSHCHPLPPCILDCPTSTNQPTNQPIHYQPPNRQDATCALYMLVAAHHLAINRCRTAAVLAGVTAVSYMCGIALAYLVTLVVIARCANPQEVVLSGECWGRGGWGGGFGGGRWGG